MARSDLRSPGNCLAHDAHILSPGIFRESKSEPSRMRACVRAYLRACVSSYVRELGVLLPARIERIRAVMAARLSSSRSPLSQSGRPAEATPGIHTGIYPLAR